MLAVDQISTDIRLGVSVKNSVNVSVIDDISTCVSEILVLDQI